jgi:hypothetical protein
MAERTVALGHRSLRGKESSAEWKSLFRVAAANRFLTEASSWGRAKAFRDRLAPIST